MKWDLFQGFKAGLIVTNQSRCLHQINKMKEKKNHIIISIDAEAFDKIQHPFMIKLSTKWVWKVRLSTYIKAIHDKPIANIIFWDQEQDKDAHTCHYYASKY